MADVANTTLGYLAEIRATPLGELGAPLDTLRCQLDMLSDWAIEHNMPDGRRLEMVAHSLDLLNNGEIVTIVRNIAARCSRGMGDPS